jgi:hypothetical protein
MERRCVFFEVRTEYLAVERSEDAQVQAAQWAEGI